MKTKRVKGDRSLKPLHLLAALALKNAEGAVPREICVLCEKPIIGTIMNMPVVDAPPKPAHRRCVLMTVHRTAPSRPAPKLSFKKLSPRAQRTLRRRRMLGAA